MADLERYTGLEPLDIYEDWAKLSPEKRRIRILKAVNEREEAAVLSLCEAYLYKRSKSGVNVSQGTVRLYRRGVQDVLEAFGHENLLRPSSDAGTTYRNQLMRTRVPIRKGRQRFEQDYSETKPLSPSTIGVKLAAARLLYDALEWAGATTAKPFTDVHAPPDKEEVQDKTPPWSDEAVETLLEAAEREGAGAIGVMVVLGAHAGLRIGEMTALCWQHVDWARRRMTVHGKGGTRKAVRLTARTLETLRSYHQVYSDDLRYKNRRAKDYVLPWTTNHARLKFEEFCQMQGVSDDYAASAVHGLRHYAGTRYYRQVRDLGRVAAHLRHSSIQTTRRYAKLSTDEIGEDIDDW
ncbi:site-specific integrase [soil metagenome]